AFTPAAPVSWGPGFVGRSPEMRRIISAIEHENAHVVITGAAAVGKTSVANGLATLAKHAGYWVARGTTGADSTFETTFRSVLQSVPSTLIAGRGRGGQVAQGFWHLAELLPPGEFGPDAVVEVLLQVRRTHLILVLDEFNRVKSDRFRTRLSETIKDL